MKTIMKIEIIFNDATAEMLVRLSSEDRHDDIPCPLGPMQAFGVINDFTKNLGDGFPAFVAEKLASGKIPVPPSPLGKPVLDNKGGNVTVPVSDDQIKKARFN